MRQLGLVCALGIGASAAVWAASAGFFTADASHQSVAATAARPIDPGHAVLPSEEASAGVTKFSFLAYGDTRGQDDGYQPQREHGRIVNAMLDAIRSRASGPLPVRFIVQSGDGVTAGSEAAQWNVSFTPLIERLLREGGAPYFLSVGNHDVTGRPVSDPMRLPGLHNTLAVMSKIYPPDGSRRRLNGYATYAFGYGHMFVLAIDSNIASDRTQFAWVENQLEQLDRSRYPLVVAVFHHPPFSSGPHGGPMVESWTAVLRELYQPLFRRHRVRMTITGHDHLYEHWIERLSDARGSHRIDHLVTGGGGAPSYSYRGEPRLQDYIAAAAPTTVSLEHRVKPGPTAADNPHHFVVIEVDGDKLTLELIGIGARPFQPYGHRRFELIDP